MAMLVRSVGDQCNKYEGYIGMTLWCQDDIIVREMCCRCTEQSRPTLQTGYYRGSHSLIDPPSCFILRRPRAVLNIWLTASLEPAVRDIALSVIALVRYRGVITLVAQIPVPPRPPRPMQILHPSRFAPSLLKFHPVFPHSSFDKIPIFPRSSILQNAMKIQFNSTRSSLQRAL